MKWKKFGKIVYGLVGVTGLATLVWIILKIVEGTFFSTMGLFGSVGTILLAVGGFNWLFHAFGSKDLFMNKVK